jgi:hypothetical protein
LLGRSGSGGGPGSFIIPRRIKGIWSLTHAEGPLIHNGYFGRPSPARREQTARMAIIASGHRLVD